MRFIVYGAGGIGSGIGGHRWRTGHDTILVGRPGHVGKIEAVGLRLITGTDAYRLRVPAVTPAAPTRPPRRWPLPCAKQPMRPGLTRR